jgi:hypothetical protein
MKQKTYEAIKSLLLMSAIIIFFGFAHRPGGDHYKILLNNKLVAEQFLTMPVELKTMDLGAANGKDLLTIYYSHCGTAGKSRTIWLRNEEGKILKEWKFPDSKEMNMTVPVKEILQLKAGTVSLYYTSSEIPSGKQLIRLHLKNAITV